MKVSFVIAVYNGGRHLQATVESVLAQSERDIEVVIVDDGSTDGTPDLLATVAKTDPRVRVLRQENAGLTRALVAGCAAARGEFVARQDSGDVSAPSRVEVQRRMLEENPRLAFVSCSTEYVGPDGEHLYDSIADGGGPRSIIPADGTGGATGGPTHHGSVMFRRSMYEAVGGYRVEFRYAQDWDLWYRLSAAGDFDAAPAVLYVARIAPDAISSFARPLQFRLAELSLASVRAQARGESVAPFLAEAARLSALPRKRGSKADGLYFIGEALRRNRDARCRFYLRRALAERPWSPRTWLRLVQSLAIRRAAQDG